MCDNEKKVFNILKFYFRGDKSWVSEEEMIRFLANPPTDEINKKMALPFILDVEQENEFRIVHVENGSIYIPLSISMNAVYMVIYQIMYPEHWHYYEYGNNTIDPNDIVVDCGAAEGLFSLIAAKKCKQVYAIEPMLTWTNALEHTFEPYKNIELIRTALSNENGYCRMLEESTSSRIDSQAKEVVRQCTIDSLFYDNHIPVTFIKADLEGSDVKMLEGARKTIGSHLPKLSLATYHNHTHATQMKEIIYEINPKYKICYRGISLNDSPVMLHAWI